VSQLCTLNDVKVYGGITTTADDAAITALITQASGQIEQYCNRTFAQAAYTETRNGRDTETLYMRQQPIVSVQSLTIDGITIQASPDTRSYGYVFDDAQLYLRGTARGPYGQPGRFVRGFQNITVAYTAGFQTIPADVVQACVELVLWKRAKRTRIDNTSQALGDQQTQAYDLSAMPKSVAAALSSYRVPMVPA